MAELVDTFLEIDPIDLAYTKLKKDSLKGEVAVITGGTSNIGLGYARAIAWAGGKVVVASPDVKDGVEVERVINAENNNPDTALYVNCDVTKEDDIKNLSKLAFEKFGKVDILINNAMILSLNGSVLNSPISDLEKSYAISGRGVMLAIKEFVPAMVERKHGIVVYSTTQFHYHPPMIGGAMYCAGKAAATSLVMSLANEIGAYEESGVSVFCMIPASVLRPGRHRPPNSPDGRDMSAYQRKPMPGFEGTIPPEAAGAALVYCVQNAGKLHGSGINILDAFDAMDYPYERPETVRKEKMSRLNDTELTFVFANMGPGFDA